VLAGFVVNPAQAFRSYLVAFVLFNGVALGCLAVVMIQYLTGGNWGFVLRRVLEAGTQTLPLLAVLFLPLLVFGLPYLYEWAQPDKVEQSANLQAKANYLNVGFFVVRAVVYFAVWNGLMVLLNRWSKRQDTARDPKIAEACLTLSGPGLVLLVVTVSFAAIDWMMSLEPEWYSTIYPAMVGWGFVLSGYAFCLAVLLFLRDQPAVAEALPRDTLGQLATLLLAFVMVWAYLSLMQFILIWAGNLPEEVPWYVRRLSGGWSVVALTLIFLQFALPFGVLLSHRYRRTPSLILGVVGVVLLMRFVDLCWLVMPAFQRHDPDLNLGLLVPLTLVALVGVGGVWLWLFLRQLRQLPLVPLYRPPEEESDHHG
jgi:hypothetical protein